LVKSVLDAIGAVDLVASIRSANANQDIVLRREERGDVTFAFATILATDEDIDESIVSRTIETEVA
jgi:hypothetical protein